MIEDMSIEYLLYVVSNVRLLEQQQQQQQEAEHEKKKQSMPPHALDLAIREQKEKTIQELLDKDPKLVHRRLANGIYPITRTAQTGNCRLLELLVHKYGAHPDGQTWGDRSHGQKKQETKNVAQPITTVCVSEDDAVDVPLFQAIRGDKTEAVAWLLNKGKANPNIRVGKQRLHMGYFCLTLDDVVSLGLLVAAGLDMSLVTTSSETNTKKRKKSGSDPHPPITTLANSCSDNAPSWSSMLHHCSQFDARACCLWLLTHDCCDVNTRDPKDETPLMWSAYYGNLPITRMLVQARADVHAVDKNGKSAMDHATEQQKMSVCKYLQAVLGSPLSG